MATLPELLEFARSSLLLAKDDLTHAQSLAKARHYATEWTTAISLALKHNDRALAQVANVATCLELPTAPHL